MKQKEIILKEKRTSEATRKNLMGSAGKLGMICKYLGVPIRRSGGSSEQGEGPWGDILFDRTELEDPYTEDDPDELPTFDDTDEQIHEVGWLFDGLSSGMHLEIIYQHEAKKLTVTYKGYLVYAEIAGDLERYAPFDDWEKLIEKLYTKAKERHDRYKKEMQVFEGRKIKEEKMNFLQKLRLKWGI